MLFDVVNYLFICILAKEITVADSYWAEFTDLGEAQVYKNVSAPQFGKCSSYNISYGSSCTCYNCGSGGGRCTICCNSPGFVCCYCNSCSTSCWANDWQFISIAQVGISTAILFGTIASIALFFRICNGGFALTRRDENGLIRNTPSRVSVSSVQQYIIERLQDRPPQYNNASDAPPTYDADPSNSVATIEDPPKYTRKPLDTENLSEPQQTRESSSQPTAPTAAVLSSTSHM